MVTTDKILMTAGPVLYNRKITCGKDEKLLHILVLGIGNPILRDDGIGPRIIDELRACPLPSTVTLAETSLAGMALVETLSDHTHAIIIDAIQTGEKVGTVYRLTRDSFQPSETDPATQHNIGILEALHCGSQIGLSMPGEVVFIAIEAGDVLNFGEGLTPAVEEAVPGALRAVMDEIKLFMESAQPESC